MIIVGTSPYAIVMGVYLALCPACGERTPQQLLLHGNRLTLFFIPLVKVSRHYLATCGWCHVDRELPNAEAEQMYKNAERLR